MSIREKYAQRAAEQNGGTLSDQIKEAEEDMSHGGGKKNNWLKTEEGFTDYRFFPSTVDGVNFMFLKKTYRLPIEVEDRDGKKEIKDRKMIFDSVTHGGTAKDIVAEFHRIYDEEALERVKAQNLPKSAFGAAIKAEMKVVNDFKTGIKPEFKWTGYAGIVSWNDDGSVKSKNKGVFDFAFSIGKKMDGLAAAQDRRGKVSETNPFISIDNGAILVIDYDKKRDPNEMYRVSLDSTVAVPWSDEDLEWLEEQPTIQEKYIGSYRRADFNMACEGLKRFDERNSIGIFDRPAFQAIVNEISAYYPEDEKEPMIIREGTKAAEAKEASKDPFAGAEKKAPAKKAAPRKAAAKKAAPVEEESPAAEAAAEEAPKEEAPLARRRSVPIAEQKAAQDQFDGMNRSQLLGYIGFKQLAISVTTDHSDSDVRDFIRTEEELVAAEGPTGASMAAAEDATDAAGGVIGSVENAF